MKETNTENAATHTAALETAENAEKRPAATIEELRRSFQSYTHTFGEPFLYRGEQVESLTFQWNSLTGKDSLAIEGELGARRKGQTGDFGREHMALIAIRCCDARDANGLRLVDRGFLEALPMVDFEEIIGMGRLFFRSWGLC